MASLDYFLIEVGIAELHKATLEPKRTTASIVPTPDAK